MIHYELMSTPDTVSRLFSKLGIGPLVLAPLFSISPRASRDLAIGFTANG